LSTKIPCLVLIVVAFFAAMILFASFFPLRLPTAGTSLLLPILKGIMLASL
jgi:hypothetical protein